MALNHIWEAIKGVYSKKEWHSYLASGRPVVLVDGTTAEGYVMRRQINKQWQYRRCTPDEIEHTAWMYATK